VNHRTVVEVRFDPKLRMYLTLFVLLAFAVSIIGIPLIPFALPFAIWWARRYYARLGCTLTDRALILRKGILFRKEMTIPLDRIQDVSLREGPLLRALGLSTLRVETAGHSTPQGKSEAELLGVVDVRSFRDRLLEERDRVAGLLPGRAPAARSEGPTPGAQPMGGPGGGGTLRNEATLGEIRDTLRRIEELLRARPPGRAG
jgi:membrane protein YdbS with pleckstrin-like domain